MGVGVAGRRAGAQARILLRMHCEDAAAVRLGEKDGSIPCAKAKHEDARHADSMGSQDVVLVAMVSQTGAQHTSAVHAQTKNTRGKKAGLLVRCGGG